MDTSRPLLVTADPALAEEVERLAAATGALLVRQRPDQLPASWGSAPAVLVGADVLAHVLAARPARRAGVVVVTGGELDPGQWRRVVDLGAEEVVELPRAADAVGRVLADVDDGHRAGTVVGVLGGAGGAGASTLAAALGQVGAREGPCLVVDADPWGPGLDRLLGLEEVDGIGWQALDGSHGRLSARDVRASVPVRDGLGVLTFRGGGTSPAVAPVAPLVGEVLAAARRAHDLVVVDLPRHGGAQDWVPRLDRLVLVVVDTLPGVAAAARACATLPDLSRVGLVVRGRRLAPDSIAATVGAPVLATMRDQRRLEESVDLGLGPVRSGRGPLAVAARTVLGAIR
jgi:secretion/DNA translocation related CpaE-like protein